MKENVATLDYSVKAVFLLILLGVVHTGFSYTLYFGSVGRLPAQTTALFSYIDPALAILLSALVLREKLTLFGAIGAVLILGSTLFGEIDFKRKKK